MMMRRVTKPRLIPPMLATLSDERALGDEWVLEHKLDGIRCIAVAVDGDVTLYTRTPRDVTARWPGIAEAVRALGRDLVLDGEVVGMQGDEPLGFGVRGGDSALWAFDLLHLDADDLRDRPLHERRALLEATVKPGGALRLTEVLHGDSERRYREACAAGWEGLIAKVADSRYVSGRSRDWLKLKCLAEQELVVGGWTEPRGSRTGLGALLVGVYEGDRLLYAGRVGTGFDRRTLDDLVAQLQSARTRHEPLRRADQAAHRRRALGRAAARGPDRLPRVDRRRSSPPPALPRPARRQAAGGRRAGAAELALLVLADRRPHVLAVRRLVERQRRGRLVALEADERGVAPLDLRDAREHGQELARLEAAGRRRCRR